jgi:phage terminase large subunit GpA-like protein
MRVPLECFHPDSGVNDMVLPWAAQTAKTFLCSLGVGYRLEWVPLPTLWVVPNDTFGRSWSETRWHPLVNENAALRAHRPLDADQFKLLEMHFDTCTMNIVGAGSPTSLAGRSVGLVVQDEACKYEHIRKDEAHPIFLADERTRTFANTALRVKASTPSVEDHIFWKQHEAGTMERYDVPCPWCQEPICFEFGRETLKWDESAKDADGVWDKDRVRASAHYVCQQCGREIKDADKPGMLTEGQWVVQSPQAPRTKRSFHLNAFYSPDVTFGDLAVAFLSSDELFGLHNFYNSWLALPWREVATNVKDEDLIRLRSDDYRKGQLRGVPQFVVVTADPGQSRTHWEALAVYRDGEMDVIDWGTVLSIEDLLRLPSELEYEVRDTGQKVSPRVGVVDSGDWTERCYTMCLRSRGFWWPSKGADTRFGTWAQTQVKSHPGLVLFTYSDFNAKNELYAKRVKQQAPPRLRFPADVGAEVLHGHSGQQLLTKRTPAGVIHQWRKVPEDHYGDCTKLGMLAWWAAREWGGE